MNLTAGGVHAGRRGAVRAGGLPMAVCSALLLALALPNDLFPLGSPLFGAACLAPLLVALYRSRSYRHAAWLGAVFGVCASVLSNFWLLFFQSFSAWTLGGVTLAYLGYHAVLAAVLRFAAGVPRAYRPFAVAAVWALYEYLKSSGYLGYPWGLIAYPAHAVTPLIQFVEITGVWGLSLLMATVNGVAAEWLDLAWQPRRGVPARLWRVSAGAALLVAAALGYGAAALQREIPDAGSADLVLVQHNANPVAERRRRRHAAHPRSAYRRRHRRRSCSAGPGGVERDRGALPGGRAALGRRAGAGAAAPAPIPRAAAYRGALVSQRGARGGHERRDCWWRRGARWSPITASSTWFRLPRASRSGSWRPCAASSAR